MIVVARVQVYIDGRTGEVPAGAAVRSSTCAKT